MLILKEVNLYRIKARHKGHIVESQVWADSSDTAFEYLRQFTDMDESTEMISCLATDTIQYAIDEQINF
jgi:hypothetical protein